MKVTTGTIVRTLVLIVALINQFLTASGKNPLPFSEDEMYQMFTALATGLTAVIAWWKNNSYSDEALMADEYMRSLKEESRNESD